jgi:hypothetical protein
MKQRMICILLVSVSFTAHAVVSAQTSSTHADPRPQVGHLQIPDTQHRVQRQEPMPASRKPRSVDAGIGDTKRHTDSPFSYPLHSNHCFPRIVGFTLPSR